MASQDVSLGPREAFVAASREVSSNGDCIDRLPLLKRMPSVGSAAVAGALVAGVQFGAMSESGFNPVFISSPAVLAAGLTVSKLAVPLVRRHQRHKTLPVNRAFAQIGNVFDGDAVEVYRSGKRNHRTQHVVWEPSEDSDLSTAAFTDKLRRLNEAFGSGIETVSIPVSSIPQKDKLLPEGASIKSRSQWLADTKKRKIQDRAKADDDLASFTAPQFEQLIEKMSMTGSDPLETFMAVLGKINPDHRAVRIYSAGAFNTRQGLRGMERALRRSIERHLEQPGVIPIRHEDNSRTKQKVALTGELHPSRSRKRGMVRWQAQYAFTGDVDELLKEVAISEQDLAELPLQDRILNKRQQLRRSEVGAWLAVHDLLAKKPVSSAKGPVEAPAVARPDTEQVSAVRGMQARIVDRVAKPQRKQPQDAREKSGIALNRLLPRRLGRSALALIASFGISTAIMRGDIGYNFDYYTKKAEPYIPEFGLLNAKHKGNEAKFTAALNNPIFKATNQLIIGSSKLEDGTEYLLRKISINKLYGISDPLDSAAQKVADGLNLKVGEQQTQFNGPNNGFGINDQIGNAGNGANQPVWYVNSYNGMESEGYWAQDSSHQLASDEGIEWVNDLVEDQISLSLGFRNLSAAEKEAATQRLLDHPYLPLPDELAKNGPLLQVRRLISLSAITDNGRSSFDAYPSFATNGDPIHPIHQIDVPVLDGTKVVAAEIGGQPVRPSILASGITALLYAPRHYDGEALELEYWLAPEPSAHVKAVGPIYDGSSSNDRNKFKPLVPVVQPWQGRIAGYTTAGLSRVEAEQYYIRSNFQYRLNPLKHSSDTSNTLHFADVVLDSKVGNCNTTGTLLAASNPDQLNYVTGFDNTNTPAQVKANELTLSTNEEHAWTVDKQGNKHDPTPYLGGDDARTVAHFQENYVKGFASAKPEQKKDHKPEEALILAASLGVVLVLRRRLKRAAQFASGKIMPTQIRTGLVHRQALAYAALNDTIYGQGQINGQRLNSLRQAAKTKLPGQIERDWRLSKLTDSHEVKVRAKQGIQISENASARRALRRSIRLHRRYAKTSSISS